ncbi:MAG: pentapeptide repeat-containing protein [Candidatus Binatia bacterium]
MRALFIPGAHFMDADLCNAVLEGVDFGSVFDNPRADSADLTRART